MHPPPFRLEDKLSDWPNCILELRCCHSTDYPIKLMIIRHGDRTFRQLVKALRCKECGSPPAPVYLVAGFHREACGGPPPDWAIELVPKQRAITGQIEA